MKSASLSVAIVTTLSLILAIVNMISIQYQSRVFHRVVNQEMHGFYEDDPSLEKVPGNFEEVSMMIQENNQFSLIDDRKWANLLPGKRGFVRLGPKGRSFAIALYHQLHCVNALRFSYTVARDGLMTDPEVLKSKISHDNHCFQFIRQSILCRADSLPIPFNGTIQTLAGAGFGTVHRCRNWARIRQFVLDNDVQWEGINYLMEGEILEER